MYQRDLNLGRLTRVGVCRFQGNGSMAISLLAGFFHIEHRSEGVQRMLKTELRLAKEES